MTPDNLDTFAGLEVVRKKDNIKKGAFMAVYGTGGSGKTTLLSEVVLTELGRPALLVDVEGGSDSVTHLLGQGLDIVNPDTWLKVKKVVDEFKAGKHNYKSIIIDNLSEILALRVKHSAPSGMPLGSATLQMWGQITSELQEFVRDLRVCTFKGYNAFMVLWEETEQDEATKAVRYKVNLTPKFASAFPGMVTMVGRLTVPGDERDGYIRQLSFAPSTKTDAKFRVAPNEVTSNIPLELYLRQDTHFMPDFLECVVNGKPFPAEKYIKPKKEQSR